MVRNGQSLQRCGYLNILQIGAVDTKLVTQFVECLSTGAGLCLGGDSTLPGSPERSGQGCYFALESVNLTNGNMHTQGWKNPSTSSECAHANNRISPS
jgi:hypothetical protein